MKQLSQPAVPASAAPAVGPDAVRSRLAPMMIGIGAGGIVALGIAVMVLLGINSSVKSDEFRAGLNGVFTAILPVFATWVGTVLAFYFTNESFKTAAAASAQAIGAATAFEPASSRMIAFSKIAKIEVAAAEAPDVPLTKVAALFNANTTRVVVFDPDRHPLYVLRQKTPPMPDWMKQGLADKKIGDFLAAHDNGRTATAFAFVAPDTGLDAARTAMIRATARDVFVTQTGQAADPVLGWIPDDKLA